MTVAKNLQQYQRTGKKLKVKSFFKNHGKKIIIGLVVLSVLAGVYGIFNLTRLAPGKEDKQDVVYQTGDQPLEQKIIIYVNAPNGLNMREEPNTASKILKTIPNNTKLEASLMEGDWYKVSFDGRTGYVHKDYVRAGTEADAVASSQTNKTSYQNTAFGYSLSFPADWVKVDYGANQAAKLTSYVGFGTQLSNELNPNILPPVAVKVTGDAVSVVNESYMAKTGVVATDTKVSGVAAKMFVFTASSGVQMSAYVVAGSGQTYILEESGGYATELNEMVSSFRML
jgi:hypothetical protein